MSQPIICVENVSKTYQATADTHTDAVRGVSFEVDAGQLVALMGPSGCGKSTLLNMLGGIDRPTSGTIQIDGQDITTLNDDALTRFRRNSLGFVFQFFNLLHTLTVTENIALPLELKGNLSSNHIAQQCQHWLAEVGLTHRAHHYPAQLSGGEMQRVAIARALIHQPKVVLADEPTGNLDSENGTHILQLLTMLAKTHGQTIIMATHSAEAASVATQIIAMRDGQLQSKPVLGSVS